MSRIGTVIFGRGHLGAVPASLRASPGRPRPAPRGHGLPPSAQSRKTTTWSTSIESGPALAEDVTHLAEADPTVVGEHTLGPQSLELSGRQVWRGSPR